MKSRERSLVLYRPEPNSAAAYASPRRVSRSLLLFRVRRGAAERLARWASMDKLSPKVAEMTRREWRDLGFFYSSDDEAREWRLTGSKEGLLRFADSLDAYATDPRFADQSEHNHFGPHMYLKVMTWPDAGIDGRSIHGTQEDLRRLAVLVRQKLSAAHAGEAVSVGSDYAANAEYKIVFRVKEQDFDPASEDPQLAG